MEDDPQRNEHEHPQASFREDSCRDYNPNIRLRVCLDPLDAAEVELEVTTSGTGRRRRGGAPRLHDGQNVAAYYLPRRVHAFSPHPGGAVASYLRRAADGGGMTLQVVVAAHPLPSTTTTTAPAQQQTCDDRVTATVYRCVLRDDRLGSSSRPPPSAAAVAVATTGPAVFWFTLLHDEADDRYLIPLRLLAHGGCSVPPRGRRASARRRGPAPGRRQRQRQRRFRHTDSTPPLPLPPPDRPELALPPEPRRAADEATGRRRGPERDGTTLVLPSMSHHHQQQHPPTAQDKHDHTPLSRMSARAHLLPLWNRILSRITTVGEMEALRRLLDDFLARALLAERGEEEEARASGPPDHHHGN